MPELTQSFQSSQFRPHKRARYASDTTSEPDSAQQQSIMELPLGHQSQESEYDYMNTTMINAITATPDISINQRHLSPEDDDDEDGDVNEDDDDDDDDDDGLEISDLPSSFPISQLTTQSSSSPTVRFQAIKQAMQEKFLNQEISFHLPSSSFADDMFLKRPDAAGEKEAKEREGQLSAPLPSSSPSRLGGDDNDDNESEISLSESEFDSQNTTSSDSPDQKLRKKPGDGMSLVESWDYSEIELEEERLRLSRRHARMAAYRAARKGTYEAWSTTCPMLSVGDNHTEKEIEL